MTGLSPQRIAIILAALAAFGDPAFGQFDPVIDRVMDRQPSLTFPKVETIYARGAERLWVEALGQPDAATRIAAAQSIALAHRQGLPGLQVAVDALQRELDRSDQIASVRLAAVHALVALDARSSAEHLFRALNGADPELRDLIEPALARWDYQPVRMVWLDRLAAELPGQRSLLLAIQSLLAVKEKKAVPLLKKLALSHERSLPVRLEAARAVAELQTSGLEPDAAALMKDASPQNAAARLIAAILLRHHSGAEASRLLVARAQDADPTVAAVALARLVELDTKLLVPLLPSLLANPDAAVRGYGIETLFREPSDDHLRLLGLRLNDPHLDLRRRARQALRELANKPKLRDMVIREGTKALGGKDWQSQEQGAILLTQLGHKPARQRMLELLGADRPEAFVAAAWGLRQLAAEDTLPPVLDFLSQQHARLLKSGPTAGRRGIAPEAIDQQLSQLVQLLGQSRHRPANDRLRAILPRLVPGQPGNPPQTPVGVETRAAVTWALGMIHEGKTDAGLSKALQERLNDLPMGPMGGEDDRVRQMAAISLGKIKAADALPSLRKYFTAKPTLYGVDLACGWAISRITGEPMPPPGIFRVPQLPWFLSSLE